MSESRNVGPSSGGHDGGTGDDEFSRVILRFARAHRALLLRDAEPLPEFVAFRNAVLDAVESAATIDDTSRALALLHRDEQTTEAAHLLVMELEGFSAWSERLQAVAAPPEPARRPWWKRALGIGKTATDSLTEILDKHLGPHARAIWKLLSEVSDIVRGD